MKIQKNSRLGILELLQIQLTSVKSIVNFIIKLGFRKIKIGKNKLYEQENLQLNIKKQKYLGWSNL